MDKFFVDVRIMDKEGSLKAFADVTFPTEIGEITAKGFRIISKEGNAPWVALPTNSYQKDGKYVNNPIIEASKLTAKRLADMILEEYNKKI